MAIFKIKGPCLAEVHSFRNFDRKTIFGLTKKGPTSAVRAPQNVLSENAIRAQRQDPFITEICLTDSDFRYL